MPERDDHSVLLGSLYMLGLSLLLFWLPIVGPLVAGFVGGRKAGSIGGALLAALLPAVAAGALIAGAMALLPGIDLFVGAIFGAAAALVILITSGLLVLGALVGGAFADHASVARRPRGARGNL